MKKWLIGLVGLGMLVSGAMGDLIISQYIETDSGTTPKGLELWNTGGSAIDFSVTGLDILKGANGGALASDVTVDTGTLAAGAVMVVGTSELVTYVDDLGTGVLTVEYGFNFNGDDALQVQLDSVVQDTFGEPGSDPGTGWSGNGVQTYNQNIAIQDGISTGDTDGWTDPSTRFETISETPSAAGGMDGFGVAPGPAGFGVTFDKDDAFTIEEGTSDTITATAQNGTEPYVYGWDSTLGATYYTDDSNTFTVLATAPAGDYSATVTVTDDNSDTASNTISFSVATLYDITITPETNGSVTTDPADGAFAGDTVTITATPSNGYAAGTTTVVDSTGGAVSVTSGEFTMPADDVTVTVEFEVFEGSALIISEVTDPNDNANAKFVELYNAGAQAIDLATDQWYLSRQANGGSWANIALTGTVAAGETYVVAYSASNFATAYPLADPPDQLSGSVSGNGNDGYFLYSGGDQSAGTLEDAYGVIDEDGDGKDWDYENSRAVRETAVTAGNPTWTSFEWTITSPANVADMTPGVHPDGAAVLGVTFDKTDMFVVAEGASDMITATAVNGTAPYTYAWSSTLGATYYTDASNTFTILATAPTGSYSATAVVTDDASEQATNTINFSVAAPSAITIVTNTPANGTVTTDPANEAIEGATVTITATPAGGYAVDTIEVEDAGSNPVAVVGNTFTMPDSAVTVTVTFMVDIASLPIAESYDDTFDWTTLPGWSGESMSTYSDGSMSFNASGDILTVNFDGTPGELTFDLYGNPSTAGDPSMQYDVEESADGSNWTTVVSFGSNDVSTSTQSYGPYTLNGASRYVRWNYVNKHSYNVALNNVAITSGGPPVFSVSFDKLDGFEVDEGTSDTITATATNGTPPYEYSWGTTLPSGYSSSGDTFTILATAPTGSYSATVTATEDSAPAARAVVTNTINFSVVGLPPGQPAVIISGDTSGTVGEELVLNITVTNETANDWQFVLTDPDGLPDYTADYSGFPPLWALTPSKTGTYVLAVTVLTGSGNYSNTANLAISAASSNPAIPTVAFAGDGSGDFSFDVPTGYELFSVQGAGPALDEPNQQFVWSNLTLNVDYTVTGANLRILTDQSTARMIRIWLMEE